MEKPRIGQELLDVPMGDMIRQMAFAIAEAQMKLDANSIDVAEMMGGLKTITDDDGNVTFEDSRVFFGKETITVSEAVERLNSGIDDNSKKAIFTKLGITQANDGAITPATNVTYNTTTKIFSAVDLNASKTITIPQRMSMLELGFTPTFYQFVDTILEVKIAIKYTQESSSEVSVATRNKNASRNLSVGFRKAKSGTSVSISQVNATYSQKYSYSAEGSSLLRTKLVPIPPPAILEERIRKMIESEFEEKPSVPATI